MKIVEKIANDVDAIIQIRAASYVAGVVTEQNDPEAAHALQKLIVDGVIQNLANRAPVRLP